MGERRTVLKPYEIKYICDCGLEMKSTGIELLSLPPKYPHICDSCGNKENLLKKYPIIGFKTKKDIDN